MHTNRKNARWAGVFYIIATVAPIWLIVKGINSSQLRELGAKP